MRTRFAPSPTGNLHLGNARTALFNWLLARQAADLALPPACGVSGGQEHRGRGVTKGSGAFILRIEDTDRERSTPEAEQTILEDLRWLGIDWDEGPDCGGAYGPYRQSDRGAHYAAALETLQRGERLYPCFCTPEQLEAERQAMLRRGLAPRYGGTCRQLRSSERAAKLAAGAPHALRFLTPPGRLRWEDAIHGPQEVDGPTLGDFIVQRSDGSPTYNLAVVVDDSDMVISHVVRGDDHLPNTPRQLLLYAALGAPVPCFAHVPLLVHADQRPLSKRDASTSLRSYRREGYLASALRNFLALLGWSHPEGEEVFDTAALLARFDLARVRSSPATVPWHKLRWLNATYLRRLDAAAARQALVACDPEAAARLPGGARWETFVHAVRQNCETLRDLLAWWRVFEAAPLPLPESVRAMLREDTARRVLHSLRAGLAQGDEAACAGIPELLRDIGREHGIKGKALYRPVRLVLTGREHGPELAALLPLMGRALALQRLDEALQHEE
ncbi:MAG: glutamate--tRNA ligase [Candidatus Tectomicrobia bacterium]|nr:glutamate--tRNA ligase [Candidatus Tectomicrobia bacterium]